MNQTKQEARLANPDIYWVVADGTDAGKTTLAAALVSTLNRLGTPTIGFKPYSVAHFQLIFDFFSRYCAREPGFIIAPDGWQLMMASPLTRDFGASMVEAMVPVTVLSYPRWKDKFILRTGSVRLNNRELFISDHTESLLKRNDFTRFHKELALPFERATKLSMEEIAACVSMHEEKKQHAFGHLVNLGAQAVVCEGASQLLPAWRGMPRVNHIFYISSGKLTFFPNLDIATESMDWHGGVKIQELLKALAAKKAKGQAHPLYLATDENRDATLEKILRTLLAHR